MLELFSSFITSKWESCTSQLLVVNVQYKEDKKHFLNNYENVQLTLESKIGFDSCVLLLS